MNAFCIASIDFERSCCLLVCHELQHADPGLQFAPIFIGRHGAAALFEQYLGRPGTVRHKTCLFVNHRSRMGAARCIEFVLDPFILIERLVILVLVCHKLRPALPHLSVGKRLRRAGSRRGRLRRCCGSEHGKRRKGHCDQEHGESSIKCAGRHSRHPLWDWPGRSLVARLL
jgi:hypothetical protein